MAGSGRTAQSELLGCLPSSLTTTPAGHTRHWATDPQLRASPGTTYCNSTASGSLLLPPHVEPDRTVSRQRRAAQPGALDGGLEAIRPQKANIDTPVGWTQPVGDSAKTGHRTSSGIESAKITGLDTPDV